MVGWRMSGPFVFINAWRLGDGGMTDARASILPKSGLCFAPPLSQRPGMSVALEVPNEVTLAMRLPAPEAEARLRLELAIGLYTQRLLPLGKAARLAGLNRWEFDDILARRDVPAHYTEEDLIHDAAYADRHQ
jgi:predicted HTH domain antitoxin